jgi:hypothetical protein
VIHAQSVKNSGVQVMNVHGILHCLEAELVGVAVGRTAFDATAGQQRREAVTVVIAAILYLHQSADFKDRRTAEFAADDDQGFLQQAGRLQVSQ